ncbi:hypothetical protein [Limnobacter sp.]|uniref:hypothetical protein n=1 Tax=Limnobacter sp. TaxID=2003368 RepID=UPI002FDF2C33
MPLTDFLMYWIFFSSWGVGFGLPLCIMLMTWVTPQSVIDRYVRTPHFSEFEAVAYRYFPSSWIRTLLFTMAIAVPVCRKIRQFGNIHKNVPVWFNVTSRVFVYFVLGYCVLLVLVVLGMYFYALWLS